jgi:hypothetical protein
MNTFIFNLSSVWTKKEHHSSSNEKTNDNKNNNNNNSKDELKQNKKALYQRFDRTFSNIQPHYSIFRSKYAAHPKPDLDDNLFAKERLENLKQNKITKSTLSLDNNDKNNNKQSKLNISQKKSMRSRHLTLKQIKMLDVNEKYAHEAVNMYFHPPNLAFNHFRHNNE